jgi:hypothetical protein
MRQWPRRPRLPRLQIPRAPWEVTRSAAAKTRITPIWCPRRDSNLPGRQAGDQHKLTGWAHLHAVADRVSVLACEGRLTDADRDRIHDHLREAFSGLDRLYGKAAISSPTSAMTMATAAAPTATAAQSIRPFAPLDSFRPLRPPNGLTALRIDEESNRLSAARTRSCNLIWRWGRSDARCKRSCRATRKPGRHPSCCAM